MYHRIAMPEVDPWGLAVPPERFAEQLEILRKHRTILSMESFVGRLQSGDLPCDALALKFDDGYIDNLLRAKPILEAVGVPATVFVTTGLIGSDEEFWWDQLARMILLRKEAIATTLTLDKDCLQIELPPIDPELEPRPGWRAWEEPVTAREDAYKRIWSALWDRAPESRKAALVQLSQVFGGTQSRPEDLPMGVEDVPRLVSDWISVGAHSRFHRPLVSLPPAARLEEMVRSREEAEALSASPVTGFAYPHGASNPETEDMARRAGYRWACTVNEQTIDQRRVGLHSLPRISVGHWSGEALLAKLRTIRG